VLLVRFTLRKQCLRSLEQRCVLRCISVRRQPHCTGRLGDFQQHDSRLTCGSLYLLVPGVKHGSHMLNGLLHAPAIGSLQQVL
jgi:hypothetical protein